MPLTPGRWLQVLGLAHGATAAVLRRTALREIAGDRLVGAVPDHGDRAAASCLDNAPVIWTTGRLLQVAEDAGDLASQRAAGRVLVGSGLLGVAAMPASPFWLVLAIGSRLSGAPAPPDRGAVPGGPRPRGL